MRTSHQTPGPSNQGLLAQKMAPAALPKPLPSTPEKERDVAPSRALPPRDVEQDPMLRAPATQAAGGPAAAPAQAQRPIVHRLTDGPGHYLAHMPPSQMAAVLRFMLQDLQKDGDHTAITLLLADLGQELELLVPDDASHTMAYVALADALRRGEARHGPNQGEYHRPHAIKRWLMRCLGRR